MSGPKCYRYRVDAARLEAERQRRLQHLRERAAANSAARTLLAEFGQHISAPLRTAAEVLENPIPFIPGADRQAEWQRLFQRLNEEDQHQPPTTLLERRDAFLNAASPAQADALAMELRQHIQQLNQAHRIALAQRQEQEDREIARRYTQQVMNETLAELGYDVEPGFATLFVEGGVAHIQQPDWGDYYVRLRVKPECGDLNLNVVRVSEDRAAPSHERTRRDREMEEAWCAAHRELLQRLEAQGIVTASLRAQAPGALPIQCIPPEAVQRPSRTRRRQNTGQLRQREI